MLRIKHEVLSIISDNFINRMKYFRMEFYDQATKVSKFRRKMMGDYMNFGISPEGTEQTDVVEANRNMIDYVIKELEIKKTSRVLEIGCGIGGYILGVAKRTGCSYVGLDIYPSFVADSELLASKEDLQHKGHFLVGGYEDCASKLKGEKFTHIISLGSFLYVHPCADEVLSNMAQLCSKNTVLFIQDFCRPVTGLSECPNFMKHINLPHNLMNQVEFMTVLLKSRFRLKKMIDSRDQMLPSLKKMRDESILEDPTMEEITYPYIYKSILERETAYICWTLVYTETDE